MRVLKPGGVFIIFDGYLRRDKDRLSKKKLIAMELIGKTMAINEFEQYENFKRKAMTVGFTIDFEEDVSTFIVPNLKKFEKLTKFFFNHRTLAKIIIKIFPKEFVYNAIAGYLLPNMIELELGCYLITILKKR